MSICPVDENGYCSRHQTVHFGRLLEISQLDNEFGEKHRMVWDRQAPGPLKRAANFGRAVVRHLMSGAPKLDDVTYQERLAICAACEDYCDKSVEGWCCTHVDCGCRLQEGEVMPGKARWASEDCPIGRWPLKNVITPNQSGGCGCQ